MSRMSRREPERGDYWNQEQKNNVGPEKVTFGDAPCHGVLVTGLRSGSGNVIESTQDLRKTCRMAKSCLSL